MEPDIWRIFVSLGVPGLALGVLYMLFRQFKWQFPIVPHAWVGPIIVLFIAVTRALVYSALYFWSPVRPKPVSPAPPNATTPELTAYWKQAWLAIRDRHKLYYTHYPQGYGTAANREDLLKILNRLNIDKDSELSALQSKLVRQIELAEKNRWPLEHDPRVNMVYSQTLREGLEDLEFRIRNHAVEHGVQVEETKHD